MNLETKWTLKYGDDRDVIEAGDTIKVYLETGEILIGEYLYSDWTSLNIERKNEDIDIDFEDVKDIEKLN